MDSTIAVSENFEITPCEKIADIESRPGFKKLELTSSQKIQMGGLLQQMPALAATGALSGAYVVRFPEGVSKACHLMQYKDGGWGTPIQGLDGKIVGHASLQDISAQAAVLGVFNVMSVASGQYFLAQINSELKTMNRSIDRILEFLYGDKKAELVSEVSFVKGAYQNYSSIMEHEQQCVATIVSLQEARKVAMKDIEFYMSDLDSAISAKNGSDVISLKAEMFRIKDCLELSMQLYSMSSLLEIYYSQNYDTDYICRVEGEGVVYISRCEKLILTCFSKLSSYIQGFKEGPLKKIDKQPLLREVNEVIDYFGRGAESEMIRSVRSVLHAPEARAEYYVSGDGELYLKTA